MQEVQTMKQIKVNIKEKLKCDYKRGKNENINDECENIKTEARPKWMKSNKEKEYKKYNK